jgi:hypothetical protein
MRARVCVLGGGGCWRQVCLLGCFLCVLVACSVRVVGLCTCTKGAHVRGVRVCVCVCLRSVYVKHRSRVRRVRVCGYMTDMTVRRDGLSPVLSRVALFDSHSKPNNRALLIVSVPQQP